LLHLMLQSLIWIATISLLTLFAGWALQVALDRVSRDRRQKQTLRTILNLGTQLIGLLLVLLVIFGTPAQMPTILGLVTAGLTVVFQDFILAFCGWFVLMGRNGIRVGDWVEIDGVGGEVVKIGLFRTWLLETGNWTANGHPTGRRVSFLNGYAIRGKYFNFSTAGQWMWDEIKVSIPSGAQAYPLIEKIREATVKATEADAKMAEQEWKRVTREEGSPRFSATPSVDMRPAGAGVDIVIKSRLLDCELYPHSLFRNFWIRNDLAPAHGRTNDDPTSDMGNVLDDVLPFDGREDWKVNPRFVNQQH
jgi:small-conductance mechanosensitive channel